VPVRLREFTIAAVLTLSLLVEGGCATTGAAADSRDPLERVNRQFFSFNEFMDRILFDPIGRAYKKIVPVTIDRGFSNAFSNAHDVTVIANDVLQFKLGQAISDLARVVFNSTIGIGGFFDVSSRVGLPKHYEDLGQTLGVWGVGPGPYLVAPFIGPLTLRDAVALSVETYFLYPISYVNDTAVQSGLLSLEYVDFKADRLKAGELLGEAALDKYDFTKNAFLERRDNQIHDVESSSPLGE